MLWRGACAATKIAIVQPGRALQRRYKVFMFSTPAVAYCSTKIETDHNPVVVLFAKRPALTNLQRSCHPASKSGQGRPAYFSTHHRLVSHNTLTSNTLIL
jgi:hypothetical protein